MILIGVRSIYLLLVSMVKMDTKAIGKILGLRFDAVSGDGARALIEVGLPADAAILDVGTGNGNFAIYLASEGYQVLTGEQSTDKVALRRQKTRPSMRANCPSSQRRSMRSFSSLFFIMSTKMSEARFSAKPCESRRRSE